MKKWMLVALALLVCVLPAYADDAVREYAEYLESALPGAAFVDAEVPAEWTDKLGEDYALVARTDAAYGTYIAAARKDGAENLFYGVEEIFSPEGDTRYLVVEDADGTELERIDLGADWNIRPYSGGRYFLIYQTGVCSEDLFLAATESGRAGLAYRNEKGFAARDPETTQIVVMVHSYESWQSGATTEPIPFYIDAPEGLSLTGSESMPAAEAYQNWDVIPVGVYVTAGEETYSYGLVTSADGKTGVMDGEDLRSAGSDYARVLDLAEIALGYRPGDMDFLGRDIIRAAFQWQAGSTSESAAWEAGEVAVTDPDALAAVKRVLSGADFTVGSVKCPAPAFLVLEFADGGRAEIAVAVNSFDLFFYRGVCFAAGEGEDFLELFGIKDTDFYRGLIG